MNILRVAIAVIAMSLVAGLSASCGGGAYGGGGGSNPPASLNLSVTPNTITLGGSATLAWSTNGNTCTASGAWSGTKPGSGSEDVTPAATGMFTYSLRCRGGGYGESSQASATLTVNPAVNVSGLFVGEACCVDAESVAVTVLASRAGEFRFLARGTHVVGQAGKLPVVYDTCDNCLSGRRIAESRALEQLAVTARDSARGTILVKDRAAVPRRLDFRAPFDRSFDRPASLAALQGTYTTSLGTGYTFTLTVDRTGEVNGADSRGCMVRGVAAAPRSGMAAYRLELDVSACGPSNGRYLGNAALVDGTAARPAGLFLSASNENAAIGWRLSR